MESRRRPRDLAIIPFSTPLFFNVVPDPSEDIVSRRVCHRICDKAWIVRKNRRKSQSFSRKGAKYAKPAKVGKDFHFECLCALAPSPEVL